MDAACTNQEVILGEVYLDIELQRSAFSLLLLVQILLQNVTSVWLFVSACFNS